MGSSRVSPRTWAATAGVVSAAATLAVAELVSLVLGGIGNPVLAVGSLIIDLVPPGFKSLVISLFDTADKLVLFVCLGAAVLVVAAIAGVVQWRRPPVGLVILAAVAVVALVAVLTRAEATAIAAMPTVMGAVTGAVLLHLSIGALRDWVAAASTRAAVVADAAPQFDRRRFLRLVAIVGVSSAVVGIGARALNSASAAVRDLRARIRLPAAADVAVALPVDPAAEVSGLSSFVTPNTAFYRIDTALQVPSVDPSEWRLRVTGMVEREIEMTYDELVALPLVERYVTLACVSNEVGGDLIGNALWLGHPLRDVLARAVPLEGADMVLSTSVDGFTASTPLDVLQDDDTDALLAVGMNGEPLPLQHGFPVRMVVPGLYGYVSATKWVTELKVTTFADDLAYWSTRGWTERGPVKISSRIDTPTSRSTVEAGRVVIAGVAWAQHTGIASVEVQIDGGRWREATLATDVSVDTWLQWWFEWEAEVGDHEIVVRAMDVDGLVQTADIAPVVPDGATGRHTIELSVA
ncbi:molybdopterin-dependent oxidoreductase [Marisediminicola sp. LYQ134]|uniref:molybdopterin-dependent oxidoreductase n=1 Tax=Marisediminicola sp. LYQ134 TaxID=3391061 RepID=UPI00398366C3